MTVRELQARLALADPDAEVVLIVEDPGGRAGCGVGGTSSAIARTARVDGEACRKHQRVWLVGDRALDRARGE